jgi:hypothetical protein
VRLVEELEGMGELSVRDRHFAGVAYRISRFQGFTNAGLPVPGVHRIEGNVNVAEVPAEMLGVGSHLTLKLPDGRTMRLTLAGEDGRVLEEGHGPSACLCC